VCIIPARGGSRRVPGKNVRLFHGKPIIAYSIECALASELFDEVLVSTDDLGIASIANDRGAGVVHRPAALAVDNVGTQDVMKHALGLLAPLPDGLGRYDYACCLYATAPMATPEDLRAGLALLCDEDVRYVFTVNRDPLFDAGQWYWGKTEAFRAGWPLIDSATAMYPLPPERVCDINTEEDFRRAETMYARLHGGGRG
jgi:N-acylneuraminate cytidylyltransferase